jgi:carboxymethylenebutenolidase
VTDHQGVTEEELRFAGHGRDPVRALCLRPSAEAEGPRPGVVLIHGVFGLDAHALDAARLLARAGYVVLAPDLYSREGVPGPQHAVPDRRALGDLEAAAAALVERGGADPERVAAVGFCTGGSLAFLFGCASTRVAAVVDFYGRIVYPELSAHHPTQPLELALNLGAPVLFFAGESDPALPPEHVALLRRVLSQFGKDFDIVTYPGVAHGFLNDRRGGYDAAAAADAWRRTLAFLAQRLA